MAQLVLPHDVALERIQRAQELLTKQNKTCMFLPVSADLEWLTGYQAHALERLTVLIVRQSGVPILIAPELEVVTLEVPKDLFIVRKWSQSEDPFKMALIAATGDEHVQILNENLVVGKKMPAMHLLPLMSLLPQNHFEDSTSIIAHLRRQKDQAEIHAMAEVARCVDLTIAEIQQGKIPLLGRTERAVAEDVKSSMLRNGHDSVSFCIVATGPNSADPHHEPDDTVIKMGHVVLFDIGGRRNGYSSDITRCVVMGPANKRQKDVYHEVRKAQQRAFEIVCVGIPANIIDSAARESLDSCDLGQHFVHSTGHGIGLDEHEDPFITKMNTEPLLLNECFSLEPGVYLNGEFGFRLEDIVIVTNNGAMRLNYARRDLIELNI